MAEVDDLITQEVVMYIEYCRLAAQHDDKEPEYRNAAHELFYHIQELRTTRTFSILSKSIYPISNE